MEQPAAASEQPVAASEQPAAATAVCRVVDVVAQLVKETLDKLCREAREILGQRKSARRSAESQVLLISEAAIGLPLDTPDEDAIDLLEDKGVPPYLAEMGVKRCQRHLLKTFLTVLSFDPSEPILRQMDEILRAELSRVTVTRCADLFEGMPEGGPRVVVWRGDICRLDVDAIVNACNDRMLGCMRPNHPCIDNAIHCGAGPRLRKSCREFMAASDFRPEPTGQARITDAYNLPCKKVLHTVGPIAEFRGQEQPQLLASCYRACLDLAARNGCSSIAFCCLSTGVFGYPQIPACKVALLTTAQWLKEHADPKVPPMSVVFNVFKREDFEIYAELTPQVFSGVKCADALGDYDPPST